MLIQHRCHAPPATWCWALALTLFSTALAAAESCSRPIIVGVTPAGNAVTVSADGKIGGLYVEILNQVARNGNCTFSYEPLPRARAHHMFQGNNIDILAPAAQSEERDKTGEFVTSSTMAITLITPKNKSANALAALEKGELLVNIVRGFDFGPEYHKLVAKLQARSMLEEVVDSDTVARKMQAGRIDATIMPALTFYPSAFEAGLAQNLVATVIPDIAGITAGIYLSRQNLAPEDRAHIALHFRKFVQSGDFWRMLKARYAADWALTGYQTAGPTKPAPGK